MADQKVCKTLRHLSSSPMAEGRTAEVYRWDDGHILKLYRAWCPADWVDYEARIVRAVHEAGIPSPEAGEIVEVDGRRGLIYEELEGISMLQDMNAHPWRLFIHARSLAELHVKIHEKTIAGLPSYKDRLAHDIRNSTTLHEELKSKALKRLASLPKGEKLCHGDFHPGNVLLTKRGPIVIDWMTASSGSLWTDVARTSLLLSIGAKGASRQVRPVLRTAIKMYHRAYLDHYCALHTDSAKELSQWIPVVAAARLNEDIRPERDALIKMVEEG